MQLHCKYSKPQIKLKNKKKNRFQCTSKCELLRHWIPAKCLSDWHTKWTPEYRGKYLLEILFMRKVLSQLNGILLCIELWIHTDPLQFPFVEKALFPSAGSSPPRSHSVNCSTPESSTVRAVNPLFIVPPRGQEKGKSSPASIKLHLIHLPCTRGTDRTEKFPFQTFPTPQREKESDWTSPGEAP